MKKKKKYILEVILILALFMLISIANAVSRDAIRTEVREQIIQAERLEYEFSLIGGNTGNEN